MEKTFTLSKAIIYRRAILSLALLLGMAAASLAQVRTITGTVSASDTRETLPGASVVIKGTTFGTITDINGKFILEVPSGPLVLQFSFVGYEPKEVVADNLEVVDVILDPSKVALEEVVVIGYGTVRKSDLTGSVSSIKSDDLVKITSSNPVQSLQGRVTGVQVTSTSGEPGSNPIVRVRGVGTFNNSSPIYVVDGVIMDDISFLNTADIASMEILKDASATAIYGSRGANGVIMVTTRHGTGIQEKTSFNFTGEVGIQNVAKMIDLLNGREFAIISNEIKTGSYNNVDAVPNTDWQDLVFEPALLQNYQLSATGATRDMQYYLGVGYFNQDGIIAKSSYERISIKFNNTYNLTSFLTMGTNLALAPFNQEIAPNVTYQVYRAQPLLEPYYPDGTYGVVYNVGNPFADLDHSNNTNKGFRGVGNVFADITLVKGLILRSSFGIDGNYVKSVNFTPAFTVYNPDGTPSQQENILSDLVKSNNEYFTWLWENTLNYKKEIGIHFIDALAGYTMQRRTSHLFTLPGANLIRDGQSFWYIGYPNIVDPANNVNTISGIVDDVDINQYYSMISYLFRINYTLASKYIFTATFRRDGSSKFAPENRYSNFPSFAAGWNISQEKFMQNQDVLSRLKLRASWGKIGNEKIEYYGRFSRVQSDLVTVFGDESAAYPAASYGVLGNPDLQWEVTTQTDIGLETGFLNDRLTGEFDYYHRRTDDILVRLSMPGYFGNGEGAKVWVNAASMLNRGFEFNLVWRDQVNAFKYSIGALGSTIHNEVLEIGGDFGIDSVLIGGNLGNGIPVTRSKIGLPIGAFYGYVTDGIFQTQEELDAYPHDSQAGVGDLRFIDVNKDGKIDGNDRTYIGSPVPKFIFGFSFTAEYKGFDLSLNIQGQTGNKIFNGKEVVRPDPYNFEAHVFDRWTGPGTSDMEPRPSFGGYNYTPSDKYIYDGSFVRLRNVMLGYTFPSKWSSKVYMQQLRIYFKADNIYTLTKFTGYSPEVGSTEVIANGIDNGTYPITAVYSFGLNLNF